jgi:transposase
MDRDAEYRRLQKENAALLAALIDARSEADEARSEADEARAEAEEALAQLKAAEQAVLRLQRDLEKLKRQLIGPKSERMVDPNQIELPIGPEESPDGRTPVDDDAIGDPAPDERKDKKKRRKGSRRKLAEMHQLRTEEHRSKVAERLCPCGCGAEAETIGYDVSWRLEHKPAELLRLKLLKEKVAFPDHVGPRKGTIVTAPPPLSFALLKAMCGNRLLAQIAIDKYCDFLPLYRQQARFRREGLHIARSTLCDWLMDLSEILVVIWKHMSREVLGGTWLRADATGMPVMDKKRVRGRVHRGHLWAWGNYETVLFSYTADKKATTVAALFPGFEGTVLIDGASDFNLLAKTDGVIRAGCWAHARRYLYEALDDDRNLALRGLGIIRELFMAERIVMAAAVDERIALRDALCAPVLNGIWHWVDETLPQLVPGTPSHAALQYLDNQRNRLQVFLTTAEIACHNNDTERDLRRPVKGRDNWHYAGSPRGAEAAAIYYSLIGTCLLQGIDPRRYLVEILGRLDEPPSRLTPHAVREEWQAANPVQ